MKRESTPDIDSFVLPAQTLRGSRHEMLATIDQAIVGLLALRHLIAGESVVMPGVNGSRPANPGRRGIPASLAQVGRIFENLMYRHE
ncbi:MAG: hypothetical protein NTV05_12800 [Acidobacteria bacterium]|nr:hypothetical protein [Acidobacteriota bacterium]